jgi:hypothetical protein
MQKRWVVRIGIRFEGCLVHQTANGKVRHHQAVEFLANQVWGFAAQDDLGAAQVSFQFRQCGFDLPALVIEGSEFDRRRLRGIEQVGQQTIEWLGIGHAVQPVLDDAHGHAVALLPTIALRGVDAAQIGAIG